ncbi:MAG: hypothetical protein GX801_02905 [Fibrobacter sp.]|nr:hypothetical protein [Fibrobacter sp.]
MSEEDEEIKDDKANSTTKWLIMGGILLVFVVLQVVLAVFFVNMLKPEDPHLKAMQEEQQKNQETLKRQTAMGKTLEEPIEITVNIAKTNGENYLKSSVQLEWPGEDELLEQEINARLPKIKNIIIDILSSRTMDELLTVEGKRSVRDMIVSDVNAILPAEVNGKEIGFVSTAYFVEFIIQ